MIKIIGINKTTTLQLNEDTGKYHKYTVDSEDLRILHLLYEVELSKNNELISGDFTNKMIDMPQKWLEVSLGILATFLALTPHFENDQEVIDDLRSDEGIEKCFSILEDNYKKEIKVSLPLRNIIEVHNTVKRHRIARF